MTLLTIGLLLSYLIKLAISNWELAYVTTDPTNE